MFAVNKGERYLGSRREIENEEKKDSRIGYYKNTKPQKKRG